MKNWPIAKRLKYALIIAGLCAIGLFVLFSVGLLEVRPQTESDLTIEDANSGEAMNARAT